MTALCQEGSRVGRFSEPSWVWIFATNRACEPRKRRRSVSGFHLPARCCPKYLTKSRCVASRPMNHFATARKIGGLMTPSSVSVSCVPPPGASDRAKVHVPPKGRSSFAMIRTSFSFTRYSPVRNGISWPRASLFHVSSVPSGSFSVRTDFTDGHHDGMAA